MRINIIGAGLAGLSAAITLAENGVKSNLISSMQSERAQSVMAEGGINACLNTMGEGDKIEYHYEDTMRGGVDLADKRAVRSLCENAPEIVKEFYRLGVPFQTNENGIVQRNFGGQKKKRTAFVKSSTGKMLMTALIDAVRRYEAEGVIRRYPHHALQQLPIRDNKCQGVTVYDTHTGESISFCGSVILASGGMNGLFSGRTTGTTQNTADVTAMCLENGVELANLEFIQYHPTTISIPGKRLLISEAARGEGGRLFVIKNGAPWYFMEEKYPELKNLMPRDVVSAEMVAVTSMPECEDQVYLDMTGLDKSVWKSRLSDLGASLPRARPCKNAGSRIAGYPLFYGRYLGRFRAPHLGAKFVRRGRMRLSVSRREPLGRQLAFGSGLRRKGCRKDSDERVCQTGSSAEYKMQSALFRGLPGFQGCSQSNPRRSFKHFTQ